MNPDPAPQTKLFGSMHIDQTAGAWGAAATIAPLDEAKVLATLQAIRQTAQPSSQGPQDVDEESAAGFPVEAFPRKVQDIILETHACLRFPVDFTAGGVLFAASTTIGNTYRVEVRPGWQETAVLYLAVVGRPGTNKSAPLSFTTEPLQASDREAYRRYEEAKKEYDAFFKKPSAQREGLAEPEKPVLQKRLVGDFTIEALTKVHRHNLRGLGVYADELASWLKNFTRYQRGSEEQFWLSAWSSKPLTIDRKGGDESVRVDSPHISVIGGIQSA